MLAALRARFMYNSKAKALTLGATAVILFCFFSLFYRPAPRQSFASSPDAEVTKPLPPHTHNHDTKKPPPTPGSNKPHVPHKSTETTTTATTNNNHKNDNNQNNNNNGANNQVVDNNNNTTATPATKPATTTAATTTPTTTTTATTTTNAPAEEGAEAGGGEEPIPIEDPTEFASHNHTFPTAASSGPNATDDTSDFVVPPALPPPVQHHFDEVDPLTGALQHPDWETGAVAPVAASNAAPPPGSPARSSGGGAAPNTCQDPLVQWLWENGASIKCKLFKVDSVGGLRGLVLAEAVSPGERLMRIPDACTLFVTNSKSRVAPFMRHLISEKLEDGRQRLATFLMFERAEPHSFWKPFLDLLPQSPDLPIFFTDEELKNLQEPSMLQQVLHERTTDLESFLAIAKEAAAKFPELFIDSTAAATAATTAATAAPASNLTGNVSVSLPPGFRFSFSDYRWGLSQVQSRGFRYARNEEDGHTHIIVPFFDFANHNPQFTSAENGYYLEHNNDWTIIAPKGIPAGAMLEETYGDRLSNFNLLLRYGFVSESNADRDAISLRIEPPAVMEGQMLSTLVSHHGQLQFSRATNISATFAMAAVLCARSAELPHDSREPGHRNADSPQALAKKPNPTSEFLADSEVAIDAWKGVDRFVQTCEKLLPTSLEEDLQKMESTLSARERTAVLYRVQYKRLLKEIRQQAVSAQADVRTAAGFLAWQTTALARFGNVTPEEVAAFVQPERLSVPLASFTAHCSPTGLLSCAFALSTGD